MAQRIRFWCALIVAWVVDELPGGLRIHDHERMPTLSRARQDHGADAESELPQLAMVEPQRRHIAPVAPPPIRQIVVQPIWEDYVEAQNRSSQATIYAMMMHRNGARVLSGESPTLGDSTTDVKSEVETSAPVQM